MTSATLTGSVLNAPKVSCGYDGMSEAIFELKTHNSTNCQILKVICSGRRLVDKVKNVVKLGVQLTVTGEITGDFYTDWHGNLVEVLHMVAENLVLKNCEWNNDGNE